MTPYHEVFLPIFLFGCLVAAGASFSAACLRGCVLPGILLFFGVLAFWVALFLGSDLGYRAWQSMPDPPDEAFSDASVLGAVVLGWFPGGIFCLAIFGVVRTVKWALHWANPDVYPGVTKPLPPPVETGNPYQGPNAG